MNSTKTLNVVPTTSPRVGVVKRVRNRIAGVLAFLAAFTAVTATTASAAAPGADLLGGSEQTLFTTITGFLTGSLIPLVLVLAAVILGIGMAIRYGRKAVSS